MPRSTHSRRASNRNTPETPIETVEDVTVSTATNDIASTNGAETEDTVRELPFEVAITPAQEGYKPDRSPAGRKRIPSPFEAVLPDLKGKGWQNQPHDRKVVPANKADDGTPKFNTLATAPKDDNGKELDIVPSVKDSNARIILRELSKAVKFLNTPKSKGGAELNLGLDVNVTATDVQFNIRDKQKRDKQSDRPTVAPGGGDVTDGELDDSDDDSDTTGDE